MPELSLLAVDYPTAESFDAVMKANLDKQQLAVHLDGGTFFTQGTQEWGGSPNVLENPGFRIKNWTFDSHSGAVLKWDYTKVIPQNVPLALIRTFEGWNDLSLFPNHTPQQLWDGLPRGQKVSDLKFDLQYSKALPIWKAAGLPLRIQAVALGGHQAGIERCTLSDWGAWGTEVFPFDIAGGYGQYDRSLIALLDPTTHLFDQGVTDLECSHITDCIAEMVDETLSNNQVTIRMIVGSMGEVAPDLWVQHMRQYQYQRGNKSYGKGVNLFQAHTNYQMLRADTDHNLSQGCAVGVYGDYCKNKGHNVFQNQFLDCDYAGIRFLLSPSAGDSKTLADQFSHEDYNIGPNQITSKSGVQMDLNTLEKTWYNKDGSILTPGLPLSATRYIKNIQVDSSIVLEVKGPIPGIVRTGALATNKGCRFNPFKR